LNPYNSHYYTGGSSGGSGYAVGIGLLPIALGADGGGSIRIPATYCGVFGLKPSHGRVSGAPTNSLAPSTGVLGPLAATMADLEISYRSMAKPDPSDSSSALFPPHSTLQTPRPKTLGIYKEWLARADPPIAALFQKAIDYFTAKLGYQTIDITIPFIPEGQGAHAMTILSEISTGVKGDVRGLTAANKILISVGAKTPATDFLLAQQMRSLLMQHMAYLFQKHPGMILLSPTTPNAGWHIQGGDTDLKGVSDGNMSFRSMEYVWFANFTGLPSLSVPMGYVDPVQGDGKIPVGLMATAEWGEEDALIEWGREAEGWLNQGLEGGRVLPSTWVDVVKLASEEESG
jgi:Asp-tRNA(Asn)/Glu-tRNA(Gln) amidotransferase A subunit family amidase